VIRRGLLCAALLLAISALAQPGPAQAASLPASQDSGAQTATPGATLQSMRIECTPASRAQELMGTHGCVAGRVFRATTTRRGDTHLSLCPGRRKCSFHAVVLARDRHAVGDLLYLRGKIVAIVGDVTEYRDHPVIVVRDKQQIQVTAGDTPPEFDAAQPRPMRKGFPRSGNSRAW
jgi:hypothetical protein